MSAVFLYTRCKLIVDKLTKSPAELHSSICTTKRVGNKRNGNNSGLKESSLQGGKISFFGLQSNFALFWLFEVSDVLRCKPRTWKHYFVILDEELLHRIRDISDVTRTIRKSLGLLLRSIRRTQSRRRQSRGKKVMQAECSRAGDRDHAQDTLIERLAWTWHLARCYPAGLTSVIIA